MDKELLSIVSFTVRFPSLDYCSSCFRAYDKKTHEPLTGTDPTMCVYFDLNFIERDGNVEKRGRLAEVPENATFTPSRNQRFP